MGNLGTVSLIVTGLAIVVGYFRKTNVGILTIGLALVLSEIYHISSKDIIGGFSSSLFLTMVGVMYLFGIIRQNNTLKLVEYKILALVKHRKWLIPIVIYLLGFLLTAIGPGAIPNLAIIPIIAVSLAASTGFNPIMLSLMGIAGVWGGRMMPITPEGILISNLLQKEGLTSNITHIFLALLVTSLVMAILPYLYYKGWKPKEVMVTENVENMKFTTHHILSLVGILAMVVCATAFNINVGLVSFLIGAILVALGAADERDSVKNIPWNVLLLILGVGMIMNIVVTSGGIDIISKAMISIMGAHTGTAIMELTAGVMSLFTSAIGVVFPTLVPTVAHISSGLHGAIAPMDLAAAVVVGATVTGLSPISEAGALIMAGASTDTELGKVHQNKMFIELGAWALVALVVSFLLALIGVYKWL